MIARFLVMSNRRNVFSEMKVNSTKKIFLQGIQMKKNTNTDHGDSTELASRMRYKSCIL